MHYQIARRLQFSLCSSSPTDALNIATKFKKKLKRIQKTEVSWRGRIGPIGLLKTFLNFRFYLHLCITRLT